VAVSGCSPATRYAPPLTLAHRWSPLRSYIAWGIFDSTSTPTAIRANPRTWQPEQELEAVAAQAFIIMENREVHIRAWRYIVRGVNGSSIPVYLLDTDLPANDDEDRHLTDTLYGGDERYRLCQESVLGLGGIALLRALGYDRLTTYHTTRAIRLS
jgi:starch phosphorylase